jgi:pimeloyl-ACP methyl ester carboxylesterase
MTRSVIRELSGGIVKTCGHDLSRPPRSWAERTYNLTRYTAMPRGGHFAAHEEPELLGNDLTAFFRTLR